MRGTVWDTAGQSALPKPTAANLRKFAETPVVRRAINVIKDRIASLDWQVKVRRGYAYAEIEDAVKRMLPKSKLGRQMIDKLKVYRGDKHPHEAQKPEVRAFATRSVAAQG